MARIDLSDDAQSIVVKMGEGNPGAITAMVSLLRESAAIDPDNLLASLAPLFTLDGLGIYGTEIYILWSDKCNRDTRRFVMLLRATQLGLLAEVKLQEMAADQMREINLSGDEWDELDAAVCNRLHGFLPREAQATADNQHVPVSESDEAARECEGR